MQTQRKPSLACSPRRLDIDHSSSLADSDSHRSCHTAPRHLGSSPDVKFYWTIGSRPPKKAAHRMSTLHTSTAAAACSSQTTCPLILLASPISKHLQAPQVGSAAQQGADRTFRCRDGCPCQPVQARQSANPPGARPNSRFAPFRPCQWPSTLILTKHPPPS